MTWEYWIEKTTEKINSFESQIIKAYDLINAIIPIAFSKPIELFTIGVSIIMIITIIMFFRNLPK